MEAVWHIIASLVHIMACHICTAKPLPEPMLPFWQLDLKEQTLMNSYPKYKHLENVFENGISKMSAILSRPQCVNKVMSHSRGQDMGCFFEQGLWAFLALDFCYNRTPLYYPSTILFGREVIHSPLSLDSISHSFTGDTSSSAIWWRITCSIPHFHNIEYPSFQNTQPFWLTTLKSFETQIYWFASMQHMQIQ